MDKRNRMAIALGACVLALALLSVVFLTDGGEGAASSGLIPQGDGSEASSSQASSSQRENEASSSPEMVLVPQPGGEEEEDDLPLSNEHINLEEVDRLYVQPAGWNTVCRVPPEGQEQLAQIINQMQLAWDSQPLEGADPADSIVTILVIGTNGETWRFQVGENQAVGNKERLDSTADQRAALRQLVDSLAQEYPAQPEWLAELPLERLSQVEYHGFTTDGQTEISIDTEDFDGMWAAAQPLKDLTCQPESWTLTENYAREEGNRWRLTFDTGDKYQVWLDGGTRVVYSAVQGRALEYVVEPEEGARLADEMEQIAQTIPGSVITLTVAG